jgi:hypothetical protein
LRFQTGAFDNTHHRHPAKTLSSSSLNTFVFKLLLKTELHSKYVYLKTQANYVSMGKPRANSRKRNLPSSNTTMEPEQSSNAAGDVITDEWSKYIVKEEDIIYR